MKSIQLIKQVNNTELGKSGTHETYILIPQNLNISDLFEEIGKKYTFKDKCSDESYTIRLTSAREKRIVGMGPFYRENDVMAGDKVLLEKRVYDNGECDYYIALNRAENTVYFQKVKNYFEALNTEKVSTLIDKAFVNDEGKSIKIEYQGEIQKREDAPVMTMVYNVIVGDNSIQGNYRDRDMIGIQAYGGHAKIIGVQPWKKYVVEVKK